MQNILDNIKTFLGADTVETIDFLRDNGIWCEVVVSDEDSLFCTQDIRFDRVRIHSEKGRISQIYVG